jgi:hypothetical protein
MPELPGFIGTPLAGITLFLGAPRPGGFTGCLSSLCQSGSTSGRLAFVPPGLGLDPDDPEFILGKRDSGPTEKHQTQDKRNRTQNDSRHIPHRFYPLPPPRHEALLLYKLQKFMKENKPGKILVIAGRGQASRRCPGGHLLQSPHLDKGGVSDLLWLKADIFQRVVQASHRRPKTARRLPGRRFRGTR